MHWKCVFYVSKKSQFPEIGIYTESFGDSISLPIFTKDAEKYEKSLSHVRAPYCDPNSLNDLCLRIFFSQPSATLFFFELTLLESTLLKENTCQCAWPCVLGPMTRSSLGRFRNTLRYFSARETHPSLTSR